MRLAPKAKAPALKSEQIILFRVGGALFAVSSSSVQEVRSVDSLAGAASELKSSAIRKVRHTLQRGDQTLFVVNGTIHFGLPADSRHAAFHPPPNAHRPFNRRHRAHDQHDPAPGPTRCLPRRGAPVVSRANRSRSNRSPGSESRGLPDRTRSRPAPALHLRNQACRRRSRARRSAAMSTLAATTAIAEVALQSVVLLRLGERRFAIAANQISELVAPAVFSNFPIKARKSKA